MIVGVVNNKLEATLPVAVVGSNGAITLPVSVISALALPRGASRAVTLGDTSRKVFDYYTAEVIWDGRPRKARVLCVEGDPLIGTLLLQGYKLDADFVVNGPVMLTPVP